MRIRCSLPLLWASLWLLVVPMALSQEAEEVNPPEKARPFQVSDVIHPTVAKLPVPEFNDRLVALRMAISTSSEEAEKHVLQGMALIHAAWDYEAYRHFCAAAELDPDCVMAYWGIVLSLASPNHEFLQQRVAAIDRMLTLVEAWGTKLPSVEQDYAIAVAQLYSSEPSAAAKSLERILEKYPRNLQAGLLSTFLQRDGYTEFGDTLYGQEQAIKKMKVYRDAHPDNLSVLSFWAMLHTETPDADGDLRNNVLPYVRKMVRLVPDFAPYQHLLGHFEWRCGNHLLALEAFERSSALYMSYMEQNKVDFHDCEGWVRSRLYLAAALYSRGEIKKAIAVANQVGALKVDPDRLGSPGANLVLWEGKNLAARLFMARGAGGDFDRAIAALPPKEEVMLYKGRTLSIFYLEGLRQYAACRKALLGERVDDARLIREALAVTGSTLMRLQSSARKSSSMSEYFRSSRTLEVYALELRGLIALHGDKSQRGSAYNWFQSAVDKQVRPAMLVPPGIMYPLEMRVADFYLSAGEPLKAAEGFQKALVRRPNDLTSLLGYHSALLKLGDKAAAAKIQKQIDLVRSN